MREVEIYRMESGDLAGFYVNRNGDKIGLGGVEVTDGRLHFYLDAYGEFSLERDGNNLKGYVRRPASKDAPPVKMKRRR